ncbi:MAG TPA: alkene reductase [Acetobacteraceae bacterium]|nr:alkene reductase [Acetobacteraceae bacterium]
MNDMTPITPGRLLFSPVTLGPWLLTNRVVMSPMTRRRADATDAPHALQADYYAQRSAAGLLVAEGAQVSPQGKGYPGTPGIHSDAQVAGWRLTTEAVHRRAGRIFLQLWHVGRVSHPLLQPDGALPVAPSALAAPGEAETPLGLKPFPVPHELTPSDIGNVVAEFRAAAGRALESGFDGVELHGGNGFLIDQFLRESTNRRRDGYGGSQANRARFLIELAEAVGEVFGPERVGVRISPINPWGGMQDSDPAGLFGLVAEALSARNIAYLHVAETRTRRPMFNWSKLRRRFGGLYIANGGFDRYRAEVALRSGRADLISFGRAFIANPDLVQRLRLGAPLRPADPATYYGGDARGYTDHAPMTAEERAGARRFDWRRAAMARLRWW